MPFAATAQNPIRWSIEQGARKGEVILVKVKAEIDDGWHLYSISQPPGGPIATRIWLPEDQPFRQSGDLEGPAPRTSFDENFNMEVGYYEIVAEFEIPVKPAAGAGGTLRVNTYYQTCNDRLCLPPKTVKLELEVAQAFMPGVRGPEVHCGLWGRRSCRLPNCDCARLNPRQGRRQDRLPHRAVEQAYLSLQAGL